MASNGTRSRPTCRSRRSTSRRRIESFCWRVQQLVGEGGFALVTGAPGTGKSVTLRILAERLGAQRDVKIGIVSRPQAGLADFYREMGDLFGVELRPSQPLGRRQGAARSLADPHRRRAVAARPGRRRGAGDAVRRARRVAPVVLRPARQPHPAHRRARRRRPAARTPAIRRAAPSRQPHAGAPGSRARHAGRTAGVSGARPAEGRRRQADDSGADRHALRSRPGQPACADEHRRRVARIRRRARGPADRREAVPGDLRAPRPPPTAKAAAGRRR